MYAKTILILLAALSAVIVLQATRRRPHVPADAMHEHEALSTVADAGRDRGVFDRRIDEVRLEGVPLREAVQVLRAKSGANIAVRWRLLKREDEGEGTRTDGPVEVTLRDVTLGDALRAVARTSDPPLQYGFENGVVVISGAGDMDVPTAAGVYDVRDLLPPGELPGLARRAPAAGLFGSTRAPQAGGLFGGGQAAFRPDKMQDLLVALMLHAWGDSHYAAWGGRVVLVATPERHRRVAALLRALRTAAPATPASQPSGRPDTAPAQPDGTEALDRRVRELRMEGLTPDAALEQLRIAYNANIVVRWAELMFVDRTAPAVHLRLSNVKLSQALDVLCVPSAARPTSNASAGGTTRASSSSPPKTTSSKRACPACSTFAT